MRIPGEERAWQLGRTFYPIVGSSPIETLGFQFAARNWRRDVAIRYPQFIVGSGPVHNALRRGRRRDFVIDRHRDNVLANG